MRLSTVHQLHTYRNGILAYKMANNTIQYTNLQLMFINRNIPYELRNARLIKEETSNDNFYHHLAIPRLIRL